MSEELEGRVIELASTRVILIQSVKGHLIEERLVTDELEPTECQGVGDEFITLKDISDQIIKKYGEGVIIFAWYELGLNGYI